jgi:hypothetical protein
MIGLTSAIWLPNFYIITLVLPLLLLLRTDTDRRFVSIFGVVMLLVVFSLNYYVSILIFSLIWFGIFLITITIQLINSQVNIIRLAPFLTGLAFTILMFNFPTSVPLVLFILFPLVLGILRVRPWKFPLKQTLQTLWVISMIFAVGVAVLLMGSALSLPPNSLIVAFLADIEITVILDFALFLLFHHGPVTVILILLAILRGVNRRAGAIFLVVGLVCITGTVKVLGYITGSLSYIYLYSDSRFFLFIVAMGVLAAGAILSRVKLPVLPKSGITKGEIWGVLTVSIIIIGVIPGYLLIPSGLELVNIRERFDWHGIEESVAEGFDDSIFTVDRAREFSWLTGHESVMLRFSSSRISNLKAAREIQSLSTFYVSSHFVMDRFTVVRWETLQYLHEDPMSTLSSYPFFGTVGITSGDTLSGTSMTLVERTDSDHVRIFEIGESNFTRLTNLDFNDIGWGASNGGTIENTTEGVSLVIGEDGNYTNSWRSNGPDLDLSINGGFILIHVEDITASTTEIGIFDAQGMLIRYTELAGDGLYYVPFGNVVIGDIHIVIGGTPGEQVIIHEVSIWQSS